MPVPLYVVYGSISAPIRNSPRSVCETYTWSCDETMIDVEERLQRLGHERLEDVRRDRQPDAGEAGDERRPAGGRAHDLAALDAAAVRLDRGHAPVRALEPGHLGVRVDLDAAAIGARARTPTRRRRGG